MALSLPRQVLRRIAGLASVALVATLVGVGGPLPSAQAAAGITLAKAGPSTVLADAAASYTLTAANPAANPTAAPEYNVSFRDVLPVGVTYVPGSTTPTSAGEPRIVVDATTGAQTLLWSNVTDLQVGDSFALGFSADTEATVLPVGATFTNTGSVYSNTDPRRIPSFSATGLPVAGSFTESATSAPVTTTVSALTITKSEPSPESELLRGVHTQTTVYTLIVRDTAVSATSSVVVTDYLPASLELLGCGGVDNSAAREYPGAPSLTATPLVPGCVTPASVTTVLNPPAQGSTTYPPGVYTRIQWNLGTIPAGGTVTLRYAAGIPLRANTTSFPGGTPTGASLGQVANLDNNTGASTRETAAEAGATNVARASGTYSGPLVPGGNPLSEADTRHTVTVEDLRMRKSASPTTFHAGQQVDYTVTIDASEYTSAGGVVVTDVLPNGLCPSPAPGVTYSPGAGSACTGAALPQPRVRVNGGTAVLLSALVAVQADGTFRMQFSSLPVIPANGTAVVTYSATMQPAYTGGPHDGDPTASGDSFTNTVSLTGTTTPISGTGETGPATVTDSSSATLGTDALTIDKTIGPRSSFPTASGPLCGADGSGYGEPSSLPAVDTAFRKGDVICFKVRVDFPSTASTRNPVVTDFLPVGTQYVGGSAVATSNNVGAGSTLVESPDALTWTIGDQVGSGRYPALDAVFEWVFAVTVTDAAPIGSPDVLGNAMKLRAEDSSGRGRSYRDLVDFTIVPAAPIGVVKGVQSIDAPAAGPNGLNSNVDGLPVREDSRVVFRIDLTHLGAPGGPDGYPVGAFDLWDVLPDGITCAQIIAITGVASNPATPTIRCTDPGDPNQPSFSLNATRSAIRWIYVADASKPAAAQTIGPGESFTYTYVMKVPAPTAAGFVFTNTAAVRSFQALTNAPSSPPGSFATYFPKSNIDTTVPVADQEAPPASDTSSVVMPKVTVGKVGVTSITETNNNTPNQATIGELVTYRYAVTIPAGTSVFAASLVDTLPTGFVLVAPAPTAEFCPVAPTPTGPDPLPVCAAPAPLPGNVTLNGATGALSVAGTLDNTTASAQRLLVTATARVTSAALTTAQNAIGRTNTARFTGIDGPGGSAITPVTATYTVNVRQPNPSILKTNDKPGVVVGGQTVTFTVSVLNQNTPTTTTNRPPLHDTFVVDCIPAGLTFAAYGANAGQSPVAGTGTNGCPASTTRLVWTLGDVGPSNTATTRSYTATVDPSAVGGVTFTNVATLTGSTLDDGKPTIDVPGDPNERVYSVSDTSSVTVAGSGLVKSVDEPIRTIGQTATFVIATAIPPNTNFYAASIIDTIPAGFSAPSNVTYDCIDIVTGLPCGNTGTALTPTPAPGGGTTFGFTVGDFLASPNIRREIITYTATVLDVPSNAAGVARTNTAQTAWFVTPGHTPTSAGTTFDRTGASDTATVTIVEPRLTVAKAVDDPTPDPGQQVKYTVAVTNATGAFVSDAYNTVVTDTVPTGVVVEASSLTNGGVLSGADPVTGGGTITWPASELTGPLAPGASYVLTYLATLAPSTTLDTSVLRNTARVTSYASLPSGGRVYVGPSSQASVTPQFPNLVTAKTATDGAPAYIGTPYTWTVTSTNTGGSEAFAVEVTDTLPENWLYVAGSARVSVNGGPPIADEPTVISILGRTILRWPDTANLLPGRRVTVTYRATPAPGVVTTPGVGAAIPQTNAANSFGLDATGAFGNKAGDYGDKPATASTHIDSADVRIAKAHLGAPVAGSSFAWTLTVSNAGPDTAVGPFTVTDTIEAPTTFVSATGTGWSCSAVAADVTCVRATSPGTLSSGASFPVITVTVAIPAGTASGTGLSNTAVVSARTFDPLLPNNTDTDSATVTTSADLAIAKSHSGAVVAGQDATYTLDVTNLGPSVSVAPITVVDTLPSGSTLVSAAGAGWVCTPGTGTVSCVSSTDLAPGEAAPQIVVSVAIPSSQTTTVVNTATVTGTTPDPDLANNTATDSTPVGRSADLSLQKTSRGSVVAGTTGTYRLTVDNAGPSDAAAPVRIVDTLPTGLTYVRSHDVVGSWTCAAVSQDVTCTLVGPLAADPLGLVSGDAIVDIDVAVASSVNGTVTNTATVSSPTTDPNPGNNTDTDTSTFSAEADLVVVKSHTGPATAGTNLTWHLDVRNDGPSDSPGPIVVTDVIPAGTTFVSASGTDWACTQTSGAVTCVRSLALAAGSAAPTIDLVVAVDASVGPSVLVNHASVDGPVTDPKPGNNTDSDPVLVVDLANVRIAKATTGANPVRAGGSTAFTLTVTNDGPSTADSVVVTDAMPVGLVPVSASGAGWTCSTPVGQVVTCARAAQLPGPATTIVVTAIVATDVPDGTTLTNTARVSTSTPGDRPGDNTASSTVVVVAEADLVLTKSHDPKYDDVAAGTEIVYDISVRNDGPSDAQPDITVVDTLPADLSYVSGSGPWTCTAAGQMVTCVLDGGTALAAGAPAPPLSITALVAADADAGPVTNSAVVSSPTTDPKPVNNTDPDVVTVSQSADLRIVKTHAGPVSVGDPLEFTFAVANAGPSEARSVSVTDTLPSSLAFVSATGTGWSCAETSGTVTCDLAAPLAPGASAEPISMTVTVLASAYPSVANTATVESSTPDPKMEDNTSTDTVTVPALVDLSITKTHTGTAQVGDPLTYTLTVTNAGPTPDPGPQTVTDSLPPGLRFVSGTGTDWVCAAAGQGVTCVHAGALDVGASTTYDLVVDVLPNAFPSVVNTATVSTPSVETDLTNNTAVDPTEVLPQVELELIKSLGQFDSATMLATWVIAVTNEGPNVSQAPIVVTDVLPASLTFVSASGTGWVCGVNGRTVTCTFAGAVPVGRTVAFELVTRAAGSAGTVIENEAFLTDHVDKNPHNDRSVATFELPSTGGHPHTGADTAALLLLALLAGMLGLVLVSVGRRRTEQSG